MSNFAPAAEISVKVLEAIASEREPVGISDLSRKLDINKNMIFRILNSLEECGWVYCENPADRKYSLTLKPFKVASAAVSRLSLSTAGAPVLYELWSKTGESTYLGILSEDKVMYIQHLDGTGDVKVAGVLGGRYELYCSAPGKVLLAHSSKEFIEEYMSRGHKKNTPNSITGVNEMFKEAEKIREQGYAVDREEFSNGIVCLAAPVFDISGNVAGTIGCSMSTLRMDIDHAIEFLRPAVTEAAEKISSRLGAI
ncbi:MAG: IclR family transcriptional regulator [Ruminococcaceae bacterium]|nr:IclR family transcriptional regulator [Oscillospiraceae bacterium]